MEEIPNGVLNGEEKVVSLRSEYSEDLGGNLRLAILLSMLLKVSHQASRGYVLNLAKQRIEMNKKKSGEGDINDVETGWE